MRLAQTFAARGLECAVFTRDPAERHPEAPAVKVVGVPGATPMAIARRIRDELKAFAPTDLILQYTPQMFGAWRWGSPATIWLARAARGMGINVTVLAHELFFSWSRRPDLLLGGGLMRLQMLALIRLARHVFVTVDARARELTALAKRFGLDPQIRVVRVGAGALPVPRASGAPGLRLGTFSTLGRDKRFDVVLECFAAVHRARPEAELVLLGDLGPNDDARVRSLRDAIARHPAGAKIRIAGKQDLATIAKEIGRLDVYLFPMSTGANTRSSTLPLALGTGLPVVAFKGTETDDLFADGENVVFAARLDGAAFADATLRVAGDDALARRVSAGATALYQHHLSWQTIGDQLLAVI